MRFNKKNVGKLLRALYFESSMGGKHYPCFKDHLAVEELREFDQELVDLFVRIYNTSNQKVNNDE